jgi:hypothetical protein
MGERGDILFIKLDESATLETTRQHDSAVSDADQAADRMPDGLKHAANLTISALRNRHAIPAIDALAPAGLDGAELRYAVVKLDAFEQAFFLFVVQSTQHTHRVFTLQPEARMHQLVGKFARTGQQKQTFGVQVKPANRLPFALVELGQATKHRGPVLRIVVGDDFTGGFMVSNNASWWRIDPNPDRLAVDLHAVSELDSLTNVRGL